MRVYAIAFAAVLLLSAGTGALALDWFGYSWDPAPIPGYTSGTVVVGEDGHLWVKSNGATKNTSFLPYGGTYAERLGLAELLLWGAPIGAFKVNVYDPGTAAGWSVVLKNSDGKIIDYGVRPMFATGKVRGMLYDGATWTGNTYIQDRPKTGNDYYNMVFTSLCDGSVQVDNSFLINGSPGSSSWTSPTGFGNIEDVYLVAATSGTTYTNFKYTYFYIPEPGSVVALLAGLPLMGIAFRRRA